MFKEMHREEGEKEKLCVCRGRGRFRAAQIVAADLHTESVIEMAKKKRKGNDDVE